jgi:hypothetical protein
MTFNINQPDYYPFGRNGPINKQPFVTLTTSTPLTPYLQTQDFSGQQYFVFYTLPGQPRVRIPSPRIINYE